MANGSTPKSSCVVDHIDSPTQWHASRATEAKDCKDDEEVADEVIKAVNKYDVVFARFQELSEALGCESLLFMLCRLRRMLKYSYMLQGGTRVDRTTRERLHLGLPQRPHRRRS